MKHLLTILLLVAFEYDYTMYIYDGEQEIKFEQYNTECLQHNNRVFCIRSWIRNN